MGLFRKGGGFWNNVDATITGYIFTDEFEGQPFVAGKNAKGGEKFHSMNARVTARVDGATEDSSTNLFAGGWDDYNVSEDGLTLDRQLGTGAFSTLIESACAASPDLEAALEALGGLNFEPIIGARVRFVQKVNAEATRKYGKIVDKKDPKKSYERKDLVVEEVYSLGAPPKPAAKAVKAGKGKAAVADTYVAELATATLMDILADNNGSVTVQQLSVKTLNKLMKDVNREAVRKMYTEAFFETVEGVSFDAATKTVSLEG